MTTVVYDGKVLAADSLTTVGNQIGHSKCAHCDEDSVGVLIRRTPKIVMAEKGEKYNDQKIIALAGAGLSKVSAGIIEFVLKGEDPETHVRNARKLGASFYKSSPTVVIILTDEEVFTLKLADGVITETSSPLGKFKAWGSGARAAEIGELMGFNAVNCVLLASLADPHTGGNITWVDGTIETPVLETLTATEAPLKKLRVKLKTLGKTKYI